MLWGQMVCQLKGLPQVFDDDNAAPPLYCLAGNMGPLQLIQVLF